MSENDVFYTFVLRMVERIAAVFIGGVSVYLGYRLFQTVKATGEGSGSVKLPGDVTVMVSRVAPGVFFALFGAIVVVMSYAYPLSYGHGVAAGTPEISGAGPTPTLASAAGNVEDLESDRNRLRRHIKFLNEMPDLLNPALSDGQRRTVDQRRLEAKLRLMQSVWGDDWTDFEQFQLWAEGSVPEEDSNAFRATAEFFSFGVAEDT